MITRRTALMGAAVAVLLATAPALAAEDLKLPREHVNLVAPPLVHAHEQATKEGPKIIEFKLTIQEGDRHRRCRHQVPGHDLRRLDAGPDDGLA